MNVSGQHRSAAPPRDRPLVAEAWNKEFFCYAFEFLPLNAAGAAAPAPPESFNVVIDAETSFEIWALAVVATSRNVDFRLADASSGRWLSDAYVPADTLMGVGARPFIYHPPKLIGGGSRVIVEARDRSGAANTIRGLLIGAKVFRRPVIEERRYRDRQPFTYMADFIAGEIGQVGANATAIGGVTVDQDADFLLRSLTILRTGAATLEMEDSSAGRNFFDRATHVDNLGGAALGANHPAAEFPFRLPVPRLIQSKSSVVFTVADLSGAGNDVRIALQGEKRFH